MNCNKKSINCIYALTLLVFLGSGLWGAQAQTAAQKEILSRTAQQNALSSFVLGLKKEQFQFQAAAKQLPAHFKKANKDLVGFGPDGSPLYYESLGGVQSPMKSAAFNGTKDLSLNGMALKGKDMEIATWDQGLPRNSHQEFSGRLLLADQSNSLNYSHATMVSGVIMATGNRTDAAGIAPNATAKSYDWLQDRIEAAEEAAQGLLVSNHSYGVSVTNLPQWYFGAYLKISRDWDVIQYNAPYYLAVTAAGNHANGHDRMVGFNTAKNGLSVGASISEDNYNAASFSAYGPTDDGRIKPDLVAPGLQVFSSSAASDQSYSTGSGTSYSAPKVSGTALVLQEAYKKTTWLFLKAASLKGLLIHTALDVDQLGPDYKRGWGVLQAQKAIDFVANLEKESELLEAQLSDKEMSTYTVVAGEAGLKITLSWTDLPADFINSGQLNPKQNMLVHDLDLRVFKDGVAYAPYVLNPAYPMAAATTGDNFRDPIEQIQVFEPGTYSLQISHKGRLTAKQDYSLLVSGIKAEIEAVSQTEEKQELGPQIPTETTASLVVYPNPAVNELQVNGLETKSFQYYVYRADGSIAAKGSTKNGTVAVHRLPAGFYILGVFHEKGYEALKFFKK